ncbi:MAG: TonB-dependent receptor domain-containing protein, partial [Pseudomonadales bacterium]
RLALRGYELDGYLNNVLSNQDGPEREDVTARGQLAFDATDNLTLTFKWERSEFESTQQSTQLRITSPLTPESSTTNDLNQALVAAATGGDGSERYDDERAVANDGGMLLGQVLPQFAGIPGFPDLEEGSDNEMDVGTFTIDWGLGEHTLTMVTGYAHYEYRDICDCDFAALPLIQVDATEDYDQFSQEIRLASPGGETLDYIVGAYYHSTDLAYRSKESFGTNLLSPIAPNVTRDYTFDQEQDQWAIFGSITWSLSDRVRTTLGLRYSEETKEADHSLDKLFTGGWDFASFGGGVYGNTAAEYDRFELELPSLAPLLDGQIWEDALGTFEHQIRNRERKEDFVSWSANLEYDASDEIMLFVTVSTGVKGGGFDARFLRRNNDPFF